jgi:hypothetical protein
VGIGGTGPSSGEAVGVDEDFLVVCQENGE